MHLIYNRSPVASFVLKEISYQQKSFKNNPQGNCFYKIGLHGLRTTFALAKLVAVVALPLFLILDGIFIISRRLGLHAIHLHFSDCHYLFESDIFDTYFSQLKQFVKEQIDCIHDIQNYAELEPHTVSSFAKKTLNLVNLILNAPPLKTENDKRQFHQTMLMHLRDLMKERKSLTSQEILNNPSFQWIDQLCEWLYTGPKLLPEMIYFVEQELDNFSNAKLLSAKTAELPNVIDLFHKDLSNHPRYTGVEESLRLYDPHYLGDIPSILYHYSIEKNGIPKKIKMIRTPTVTKDCKRDLSGVLVKAKVVKEFIGFLESYQRQEKKHIYFNLMQRKGSEGIRSQAIEELEQKYPNHLYVITLSKDSDFYWQSKKFRLISNATQFKEQFMIEMFEGKNYFWSWALKLDWKHDCQQILDHVHQLYFFNQVELSHQERLDFIELAYMEIIEAICLRFYPDSVNEACKSCVDRGAAALALQYLKKTVLKKQAISESQRKKIMSIVLAPAILAMNRVMQHQRASRLQTACQRFLLNSI
ncbi:hypothetical protein [Candidatus Protochlamydia sp. R18]|uniref:hypothetical protein n=1 Tax=Candidatus Protochlamydia sp. R18 TaxID=1353977 RepID=UPI0005AA2AB7|nr:hypothetical protein [Candidatus Protochlamydia sp. R18]